MPANDVDLEVLLGWVPEANGFRLTVLYNAPGDRDDDRYFGRDPIVLDVEVLEELAAYDDIDGYGQQLGKMLFSGPAGVALTKAVAASQDAPVHLRLVIDPHAPERYQGIRWETLCHPESGKRLTTSQNIRFSRFMAPSHGTLPMLLPRKGTMHALIAVANPADVSNFTFGAVGLADIAVEAELVRAREALGDMKVEELPGNGRRATRAAIIDELSRGVDVLYLVCHGRITDGRPELLLEDDSGNTAIVDGTAFANDFGSLARIPTVVVLCSCQSAGTGSTVRAPAAAPEGPDARMSPTAADLAALGPAIAYAGAAVVVAMQGNLTMETAKIFLPRFFTELNSQGVPAQAMATARLAVAGRPDWYMPVLYSRLKRGSAWYSERFGGREANLFAKLHIRIGNDHCTPIVGSGIVGEDGVLPSRQELAEQWVTRRQMPISDVSRSDLATVAQFVRVEQDGGVSLVRDEMHDLLRGELRGLHAEKMTDIDFTGPLPQLIGEIGRRRREALDHDDGYSRLARLKLPVYVTTSWTSLLEDALTEQGHAPLVRYFDWRKSTSEHSWPYYPGARAVEAAQRHRESVGEWDSGGESFTWERPLVYHLAGTLEHPRTLVLTEDDYFTWIQEWMKQVDNGIPGYVEAPLIMNSQLFLGYHFDDWEFRMMFQAIKSFQRSSQSDDDGPHVGVQLEPTTLRIDQEAAQNYLESYFRVGKVNVYWQTSTKFLTDLEESKQP